MMGATFHDQADIAMKLSGELRTQCLLPETQNEVGTANQLCTAAGAGERTGSVNNQGNDQSHHGGYDATHHAAVGGG